MADTVECRVRSAIADSLNIPSGEISPSNKRTGRRTAAERAAIDARATAFPHPLSGPQITALLQMVGGPLTRTRAGWEFWLNPACAAALDRDRAGAGTPLFPYSEAAE